MIAIESYKHFEFIVFHKKFAYYADIKFNAFVILSCSKSCWHNWLKPNQFVNKFKIKKYC